MRNPGLAVRLAFLPWGTGYVVGRFANRPYSLGLGRRFVAITLPLGGLRSTPTLMGYAVRADR